MVPLASVPRDRKQDSQEGGMSEEKDKITIPPINVHITLTDKQMGGIWDWIKRRIFKQKPNDPILLPPDEE